jgi:hypothetical protein
MKRKSKKIINAPKKQVTDVDKKKCLARIITEIDRVGHVDDDPYQASGDAIDFISTAFNKRPGFISMPDVDKIIPKLLFTLEETFNLPHDRFVFIKEDEMVNKEWILKKYKVKNVSDIKDIPGQDIGELLGYPSYCKEVNQSHCTIIINFSEDFKKYFPARKYLFTELYGYACDEKILIHNLDSIYHNYYIPLRKLCHDLGIVDLNDLDEGGSVRLCIQKMN